MELVLAHRNMDFDCLACQLAVHKLSPTARIVPAQPLSQRIKSFLALYRDKLPLVDLQYIDWAMVKHVYLVDCQKLDRLDDRARRLFASYLEHGSYSVFDHHEKDSDSLFDGARKDSVYKITGAAASILAEILRERKIKLSPLEATIIAAGIYEDTGCLTHRGTTELDALGVAYCLSQGADIEIINEIIRPKFNHEQASLYESLLGASRTENLGGDLLTVAMGKTPDYVEGLAEITSRLLENSAADAVVSIVEMKDRIHVVGRSETSLFDLRTLAKSLGGGGHAGAVSAVVKDRPMEAVHQFVVETLSRHLNPETKAEEIMRSPVRTIRPEITMEEAGRIMLRYSVDGLVVMEKDELVGVVSIRDVDKAKHHKLAHAPVRGFMSHPVISVTPNTPLREVQSLMLGKDIGRLPVLNEEGSLLGIIGRDELLVALYGDQLQLESKGTINPRLSVSETTKLTDSIDSDLLSLYREIGAVAAEIDMTAYLVGGCVRDLILDRPNFDLDFVVEGSACKLANALAAKYPQKYKILVEHSRFDTATLTVSLTTEREIDIATARTEYYEYPAALPTVEPSSLEQDLCRRDFTINALALCLHPHNFGKLVDYFNGLIDLQNGVVRILHAFSFIEDPTRIVRAARFAARLNFDMDLWSRLQAGRAIELGIFDNLGGVRLKEELRLIFQSDSKLKALDTLQELGGGLRFLDSEIVYSRRTRLRIRRAEKLISNYSLTRPFSVYLGVLLSELPDKRLNDALMRLHLSEDERCAIIDAQRILQGLLALESDASRSAIYKVLHGHDIHSLAICVCVAPMASRLRRGIKIYFEELKDLKPSLRGTDVIELGVPRGPLVGKVLDSLRDAMLDGKVLNAEDERRFVKEFWTQKN